jgi:26S proteasome regulatory subunit N2
VERIGKEKVVGCFFVIFMCFLDDDDVTDERFSRVKLTERLLVLLLRSSSSSVIVVVVFVQVFYHLGDLDDALSYALASGEMFDVQEKNSDFVDTLLAKAIDTYVELRQRGGYVKKTSTTTAESEMETDTVTATSNAREADEKTSVLIDWRLEAIVNRMFEKCHEEKEWTHAVGVAIESKRLDALEKAISRSDQPEVVLSYAMKVSQTLVMQKSFRTEALALLVKLYETLDFDEPNYNGVCQCLAILEDDQKCADVLLSLVKSTDERDNLQAYQIGFNLFEMDSRNFLNGVADLVKHSMTQVNSSATPMKDGNEQKEADKQQRGTLLVSILMGETPAKLYLEFLKTKSHSDAALVEKLKKAVEGRNSVMHGAVVFANAMSNCGTTSDAFLRQNLDWLSRATNWARFSATAGVGVIHRGRAEDSKQLLSQLLPAPSPYTLGGALYAMGLMHCGRPYTGDAATFIVDRLRAANNETVQHGACLGIGLSSYGKSSLDTETVSELFRVLRSDSAVAGEAAGVGLGFTLAGLRKGSQRSHHENFASEMLSYARKTSHEKIIRGLGLGLACAYAMCEEDADAIIDDMLSDGDALIRYGGCQIIGSAYVGTGNNDAIRKLLHVAVSDVSDDVRRCSVMSIGFVLTNNPEQCVRVVQLLSESYNPHARYGAAMAVGIACAGTGNFNAAKLLEPLRRDKIDFVQQGACIASALVLVQQPEDRLSKFRDEMQKMVGESSETTMSKMGAIMASGILDCGGRNCTISLKSRAGRPRMTSTLGVLVFTQYWYWLPFGHFLSIATIPTAFIGVDKTLQMPHYECVSDAKPSTFKYADFLSDDKDKKTTEVKKAVLSTTKKAQKLLREKMLKEGKDVSGLDVSMDDGASNGPSRPQSRVAMDVSKEATTTDAADVGTIAEEAEEKKPEPEFEILTNPSRVTPAQEKFISFDPTARFVPAEKSSTSNIINNNNNNTEKSRVGRGFVVLKDQTPEEEVFYVELAFKPKLAQDATANATAANDDEPAPPEEFEFDEDD